MQLPPLTKTKVCLLTSKIVIEKTNAQSFNSYFLFKNVALTVTARSVAAAGAAAPSTSSSSSSKTSTGVNNSFTLSPIPSSKQPPSNTITITRESGQPAKSSTSTAQNPLSKASPIPIAISKATLNQTTISKSPAHAAKPNGTKPIAITGMKGAKAINSMTPISLNANKNTTTTTNNSRGPQPKILVSTQTPQLKSPFKPIVAQTKMQRQQIPQPAQNANKPNPNVVLKAKPTISAMQQQQQQLLANKLNSLGVEMRKRPANETVSGVTVKKPKFANSSGTTPVGCL